MLQRLICLFLIFCCGNAFSANKFNVRSLIPSGGYSVQEQVLIRDAAHQLFFKIDTVDADKSIDENILNKISGKGWRRCASKYDEWSYVEAAPGDMKPRQKSRVSFFVKGTAMLQISFVLPVSKNNNAQSSKESLGVSISYIDFLDTNLINDQISDFGLNCH